MTATASANTRGDPNSTTNADLTKLCELGVSMLLQRPKRGGGWGVGGAPWDGAICGSPPARDPCP